MLHLSTIFLFLSFSMINPSQVKEHRGIVEGTISNEHGTAIQNALIYLQKDNELIKVTTSDSIGAYKITSIKEDIYSVSVSYVGYFKKEIKNVVVGKNKIELEIKMKELRCTHGGHNP